MGPARALPGSPLMERSKQAPMARENHETTPPSEIQGEKKQVFNDKGWTFHPISLYSSS
jgi:hypothetical protein